MVFSGGNSTPLLLQPACSSAGAAGPASTSPPALFTFLSMANAKMHILTLAIISRYVYMYFC